MKEVKVPFVYDAVVGVSVNSEFELIVKDTLGPKKELDMSLCPCPSGSSGNTDGAIRILGGNSHLLGLVEVNYGQEEEALESLLLKRVVKQSGASFTPIPVLSNTNIAAIPIVEGKNGEVWGKKGQVVPSTVPQALQILAGPEIGIGPQTFVTITGLRIAEMLFAEALLSQAQPGFRVLNAKEYFCASRVFKKILSLVDLLVLNRREFQATGVGIRGLHDLGPKVIVVTDAEYGGMFSIMTNNFPIGYNHPISVGYSPVYFPGGKYETGAGDWFLGALISELIRLEKSVNAIGWKEFLEVVNFSARVAGKKVTIPGGGNGPSRLELL